MKLLTASLATAMVIAFAPTASALQQGVSVGLSGVEDNEVVRATVPLKANASSTTGIRRLTMSIDGDVVADIAPQSVRQKTEANYEWDTTRYITSDQPARNRIYEINVRAVSNGGAEDEMTAKVIVDNAPSTPSGLRASAEGNKVSLSWDANPEPDIIGYRVERFYGNDYIAAAVVEGTSFTEEREPGQYSYRIVALRHSERSSNGVASAPGAPTTATIAAPRGSRGKSAGTVRVRTSRRGKNGAIVTRRIGAGGLPSGAALPSRPGLSGLPDAPAAIPWGSYKKRLPYKLPKGGIPLEAAPARSTVREVWNVVPPDGLRWVALGLFILMLAAMSRFWAWRLQMVAPPAKIEA